MDPVLNALTNYRLTVSDEQKAADLARLEKECLSSVEADRYISTIAAQPSAIVSGLHNVVKDTIAC